MEPGVDLAHHIDIHHHHHHHHHHHPPVAQVQAQHIMLTAYAGTACMHVDMYNKKTALSKILFFFIQMNNSAAI